MNGPARPGGRQARPTQRGAALLNAMMIVTLVATLAAAMIWQQWRSVQVEAAERARAQAQWILLGAVDWARLILREDARAGSRGDPVDHLGEPWALPLAEAKLSTFLAADKQNTEDAPDAFLSGQITDAQSRYNLRNLIEPSADFKREQRTLSRLMGFVGARGSAAALSVALRQSAPPTATAASAAQVGNVPNAGSGAGTGPDASARPTNQSGNPAEGPPVVVPASPDPPLMPERVEQLAWLGVDAETIRRLAPYVTILPERTPVNLNTAPKEVIAAVLDVDPADAERLVQARQRSPFKTVQQAVELLPPNAQRSLGQASQGLQKASTQSRYFEIRGRLRLQDRVVEERALVVRNNLEVIPLQRERLTALDSGPP